MTFAFAQQAEAKCLFLAGEGSLPDMRAVRAHWTQVRLTERSP